MIYNKTFFVKSPVNFTIFPYRLFVSLGDHDTFDLRERGEQHIEICQQKVHHQYMGLGHFHDIAILELCDKVEYNDVIQPISLATPSLKIPSNNNIR